MRGPPESFALDSAIKPTGHITRVTFFVYVIVAGVWLVALWYFLVPTLFSGDIEVRVIRYLVAFLPSSYLLFNVYFKRFRNIGLRVSPSLSFFVILVSLIIPLFGLAELVFIFYTVAVIALVLAPSHGSQESITIRGLVYSIVSTPDIIEVVTDGGSGTYIVRLDPDTQISDFVNEEGVVPFDRIEEKQLIEVTGKTSSHKTVWAQSLRIMESAREHQGDLPDKEEG